MHLEKRDKKVRNSIPSLIQRRGLEHVGLLQNLFPCRILCPRRKTSLQS